MVALILLQAGAASEFEGDCRSGRGSKVPLDGEALVPDGSGRAISGGVRSELNDVNVAVVRVLEDSGVGKLVVVVGAAGDASAGEDGRITSADGGLLTRIHSSFRCFSNTQAACLSAQCRALIRSASRSRLSSSSCIRFRQASPTVIEPCRGTGAVTGQIKLAIFSEKQCQKSGTAYPVPFSFRISCRSCYAVYLARP